MKTLKIIAIVINIMVIIVGIGASVYYGASGTGNILDLLAWFTHSIPFGLTLYQKLLLLLFVIPIINLIALTCKKDSKQ
jgi:hypothetical protein